MNGLTDQKFIAALTEIHEAGQGAMRLDIVYPDTVLAMLANPQPRDLRLMAGMDRILRQLGATPQTGGSAAKLDVADPPLLCLLCDYEFSAKKTPRAFVLLTSEVTDLSRAPDQA